MPATRRCRAVERKVDACASESLAADAQVVTLRPKKPKMTARDEFLRVLRGHHDVYLDAAWGFALVRSHIATAQELTLKSGKSPATTIEELDETEIFVGDKDPAIFRIEHVAKMGWLKERNAPGGLNRVVLGNLTVVSIYSYWEDHYRERIAAELSIKKEELLVSVLGDVRLMRNDIVHHASIASSRIEKCARLRWFKSSDVIALTPEQVDEMIVEIRAAIRALQPSAAA